MKSLPVLRYRRGVATALMLAAIATGTAACNHDDDTPSDGLESGGVSSLNYTPWYIQEFEVEGPAGSGVQGGAGIVMPINADGSPSEGGEVCCMTYPAEWQPDLRLTVRWLVNKKRDGKSYWYKSENVRIAKYDGKKTGGAWGIFLPGDRFRLMIVDGNHDGGNNANNRPPDDDPLIVQGVPDKEWDDLFPNGVAKGVQ